MTGESPPQRRFCECRDALDDGEFRPIFADTCRARYDLPRDFSSICD